MKNMSFGKLMAIFGGAFVVVIILAVVIIKASSGGKPHNTVVTRHQPPQFQPLQPDPLAEQLRLEQEAEAANRELSVQQAQAHIQALQQSLQQQNQALMQQLEAIVSGVNTLEQRVAALENSRQSTGVHVIKPKREPRTSTAKALNEDAAPLAADSESGHSISVGETLPAVEKPLVVRAVDNEAGIVITSTVH